MERERRRLRTVEKKLEGTVVCPGCGRRRIDYSVGYETPETKKASATFECGTVIDVLDNAVWKPNIRCSRGSEVLTRG